MKANDNESASKRPLPTTRKHWQTEIKTHLAQERVERGVSQAELAQALGISVRTYQAIEKGERQMTVQTLANIALALDVDPMNLLDPDWLRWRSLKKDGAKWHTPKQAPDPDLFLADRRVGSGSGRPTPYSPHFPDFDWPLSMHLQRVMRRDGIVYLTVKDAAKRMVDDRNARTWTDKYGDSRLPLDDDAVLPFLQALIDAWRILGQARYPNTRWGRWIIVAVQTNELNDKNVDWNARVEDWIEEIEEAYKGLQEIDKWMNPERSDQNGTSS